jgi:serine/threonine protein kinase
VARSVVHFEGAFEDEEHIHIVMEWCRGGELDHTIGQRLYTEAMVRSAAAAGMQPAWPAPTAAAQPSVQHGMMQFG